MLELAEILAKGDKNIRMIIEDEEDKALLKKMLAALKTGILDTSEKKRFTKQLKALADV